MQQIVKAELDSRQTGDRSLDALVGIVGALYGELHRTPPAPGSVTPSSQLERDLGFDSLARVELLQRVEQAFQVALAAEQLDSVETIADLWQAVRSAPPAATRRTSTAHGAARAPVSIALPAAAQVPTQAATLNEVLDWRAQHDPDATHVILVEEARVSPLTYAGLRAGARAVASGLRRCGVQPQARIALMLPTGLEYLHAYFGVLLAGAVPVPIYPPTRSAQLREHITRHAKLLANAGASGLIGFSQARVASHLLRMRLPFLTHIWSVEELSAGPTGPDGEIEHFPPAESIAMLQYTSGSTGDPKGVILSHANLLANIRTMGRFMSASPADVFVSWLPLYHDMGLIGAWLGSLYFGCRLILLPPTLFLARPERWLRAIHDYRGTLTAAPNFGYELCARRLSDSVLAGLDLSSLRLAFNGAESVDPDTLTRFQTRFAAYGFRPQAMTPVYGLAEAAVGLTFPPPGRGPVVDYVDRAHMTSAGRAEPVPPGTAGALRFVSCGRALPGYQVRIADDSGREVSERLEGRLEFTGPSATAGYYDNPGATARLIHGEWRDSGDRAYVANNEVYITGRVKDIIIRRGRHIYPEELELALGELPGVRKGCIVAFGVKATETATERLVVLAETRYTDPAQLLELKSRINQCVVDCIGEPPEEIVLARPHTVLKTSSGKLRRSATRAAYEDGSLWRTPVAPALQLLRLIAESAWLKLGRWRAECARLCYGAYAWAVMGLIGIPMVLLSLVLSDRARIWRLNHRAAAWVLKAWFIPFSVTYESEVDPATPHLIVANHCSYLDSIFLCAALPELHVFVAKRELRRVPVLGRYLRKLGTLFVERFVTIQSVADVDRIRDCIAAGRSVIVYPEGTFTREGALRAFHLGAFHVAVECRAPVIPVALCGTRAVLRDTQRLPRRSRVSIVIGQPLYAQSGDDVFTVALRLRDGARDHIARHCGEPDLLASGAR